MFASLADSMAALSRMLIFGSPPPFLAATVISRRIFEKSFPRWTSALPFFRLICDHRECPDIVLSSFVQDRRLEPLDPFQSKRAARDRRFPPPPLRRRLGHETPAGSRPEVLPEMNVREVRRARVPDLTRARPLGYDLHAHLERCGADVIERGLEVHDLVREDRCVKVHRVQARRHHEP